MYLYFIAHFIYILSFFLYNYQTIKIGTMSVTYFVAKIKPSTIVKNTRIPILDDD